MRLTSGRLAIGTALAISACNVQALVARGFPSAQDWASLNKTVNGRLGVGQPWEKPCFSSYEGKRTQPDANECKFVEDNYFDSHLARTDNFGAWTGTQWETCMATGDTCELNWANSTDKSAYLPPKECKQGSVPSYYIDVQGKDDVIAGFKFAKKTGVPLVVKNTGHDFQGRSSAPRSLALWTHHIKHIAHNAKFVPEACPPATKPASVITVGAGDQWQDIYQFADNNNLVIVGGADQSVGAGGGWILGGGHSSLSPAYGLGVDRVSEFKVVTPDGAYRVANGCQNKDLFFALRGGGGTFGVVLEVTMLVNPRVPLSVANINWEVSDVNYAAFLKVFIDNAEKFAREGWGGYITPSAGNAVFTTPKLSLADASVSMKDLVAVTGNMRKISNVTQMSTFLQWFEANVGGISGTQNVVGLPTAMASRLVPLKNHATPKARAELVNATVEASKKVFYAQIHVTSPYGYGLGANTDGASVTPAWRTALWQIILVNTWKLGSTLADRKNAYAGAAEAADIMRKITPGSGAYHNEADIHEPNFEDSFWGANYPRLVQIKKKYDPDHLMDCWHCVGWKGEKDPRFSCYI